MRKGDNQPLTGFGLLTLLTFLGVLGVWWLFGLLHAEAYWMRLPADKQDMERRGTYGDTFGMVNSLFTGLAFGGVVITLLLQLRELHDQRQERKDSDALSRQQTDLLLLAGYLNAASAVATAPDGGGTPGQAEARAEALAELRALVQSLRPLVQASQSLGSPFGAAVLMRKVTLWKAEADAVFAKLTDSVGAAAYVNPWPGLNATRRDAAPLEGLRDRLAPGCPARAALEEAVTLTGSFVEGAEQLVREKDRETSSGRAAAKDAELTQRHAAFLERLAALRTAVAGADAAAFRFRE